MSYKKNAVSYGIWALYLMGVGIMLSFMGMVIGHQDSGVPYMAPVFMALAFGTLFLVYYLAKRLADSLQLKKISSGRAILIESVLVAAFLMAGILLRVSMIGEAGEEAAYYETARVTEEGMRTLPVQGSVYYYLCLLNGLFRLVGNKWMAGIVLQLVLQMLGIIIAYFAVRRLSGKGPALVSLLFLTAAPGSVRAGITYSPKMLYFCIFALILLVIAQYHWKSTCFGGKTLNWVLAAVCGMLVAFAGYMDIQGFILVIPLCGLPMLKREQRGMLQWVAQLMLSLLVMAGAFCLLVWLDSVMSGSTFRRVLNAWGNTYSPKGLDYGFFFQEGGYEILILLALMALGIFTFMRRKNGEIFSPWVMMVLSATLMRILGVTTPNMNGSYQMYFVMTGLAGVAVCELFAESDKRAEETADMPDAAAQDPDESPAEAAKGQDGGTMKVRIRRTAKSVRKSREKLNQQEEGYRPTWESLSREQRTRGESVSAAEVKEDMTEKKQEEPGQEETRQVQLIDNPMPLPKKHVKKVMDYPIMPDASQMHYDIEVDPGDDFDL